MRSKATQRIKDRKRIARRRKIVRCSNLGPQFSYGRSARRVQSQVKVDTWNLWGALGSFFGIDLNANRGPMKPNQKDWEQ